MQLLEPAQIRALSDDPARCARVLEFGPVDFSRPFVHEAHTQLYYTPLYRDLDGAQRLRYNQLFGIRVRAARAARGARCAASRPVVHSP